MLEEEYNPPLKLVDGAEGNGYLKIDSIQLNWNSEHAGNEAGSLVNNWIDQTDLTKRGNPWKTDLFLARPSPFTHVEGLGRAWVTTYLRQLTLIYQSKANLDEKILFGKITYL